MKTPNERPASIFFLNLDCYIMFQSEEIYSGAVREVKEETGVRILYFFYLQ
jgi:hypothetical protein